ncbi:MAG TPA: signal peptidase II [Methylomirabilota bacterium]|nr:signal peptidase II [Methylomirabilota bacterium]
MRDSSGSPRAITASGTRWLWLSLAAVAADRFTKHLIETRTTDSFNYPLISDIVTLVHSSNPGIAFGMFSDSPPYWLKVLLVGGAFAVILLLVWLLAANRVSGALARAGVALIIGGAAGNAYDRLAFGAVTDFFYLRIGHHHWPAFNVADSVIDIGAALILIQMFRANRRVRSARSAH